MAAGYFPLKCICDLRVLSPRLVEALCGVLQGGITKIRFSVFISTLFSPIVRPSLLVQGRRVPGDVGPGVHPVRRRQLLPRERSEIRPVGLNACRVQQRGNAAGIEPARRRWAHLQQVSEEVRGSKPGGARS